MNGGTSVFLVLLASIPRIELHFINIIISVFYKSKEVIIIIRKGLGNTLKRNLPTMCRIVNCYLGNISQRQVDRKFLSTF